MSLKSPETYGEWYWKQSVDAQKAFDESLEETLSPHIAAMFGDIAGIDELPVSIQNFIRVMSDPPSPGIGGLIKLTGAEFGAEMLKDALKPFMSMLRRASNRASRETWLTAAEAVTLAQRKKIDDTFFYLLTSSEGYEDIAADYLYAANTPYPSIPDLILWARYHGDPDNIRSLVWEKFDVPVEDIDVWDWLGRQRLSTEQVQSLFKRDRFAAGDLYDGLAEIGWSQQDREHIADLTYMLPNAMLLVQGDLQQGKTDENIITDISKGDIHPDYARNYLDAILTKPASIDIVAYELRQDPELSGLDNRLRKIGIHPDYFSVYKELAYQIPPVADIITMAVREAFTPDIAAKFGQYQDFPEQLAEWGQKKGLSKEWTQRYWAAHWALPSPQQGFEMLHRGVITIDELNMLLRAQDVMPFWRDKLTAIAYRPLTRVDVRRMFKEGVLDESEVYGAYLDAGYADDNAKRMTEFTIRQTLSSMSKFTTSNVLSAFAKFLITASETKNLLNMLGVRSQDIAYIVSTAEYKRQWEITETKIESIRNLYKKGEYNDSRTRGELLKLDIPTEQVDALMAKYWYEEKATKVSTFTKAETFRFLKAGTITRDQAIAELKVMKYDDWHIDIYMEAIK